MAAVPGYPKEDVQRASPVPRRQTTSGGPVAMTSQPAVIQGPISVAMRLRREQAPPSKDDVAWADAFANYPDAVASSRRKWTPRPARAAIPSDSRPGHTAELVRAPSIRRRFDVPKSDERGDRRRSQRGAYSGVGRGPARARETLAARIVELSAARSRRARHGADARPLAECR